MLSTLIGRAPVKLLFKAASCTTLMIQSFAMMKIRLLIQLQVVSLLARAKHSKSNKMTRFPSYCTLFIVCASLLFYIAWHSPVRHWHCNENSSLHTMSNSNCTHHAHTSGITGFERIVSLSVSAQSVIEYWVRSMLVSLMGSSVARPPEHAGLYVKRCMQTFILCPLRAILSLDCRNFQVLLGVYDREQYRSNC